MFVPILSAKPLSLIGIFLLFLCHRGQACVYCFTLLTENINFERKNAHSVHVAFVNALHSACSEWSIKLLSDFQIAVVAKFIDVGSEKKKNRKLCAANCIYPLCRRWIILIWGISPNHIHTKLRQLFHSLSLSHTGPALFLLTSSHYFHCIIN